MNGHIICSECRAKVAKCPQGRCDYHQNESRNLIAEKLIAEGDFEFKCKFCDHSAKHSDLIKHENEDCDLRPLKCPHGSCESRVLAGDLDRHLAEFHAKCAFADFGCEFNGKEEEIGDHESDCNFRAVPCPDLNCNESVPLDSLTDHIKDTHSMTRDDPMAEGGFYGVRYLIREDGSGKVWTLEMHEFDGKTFFLQFDADSRSGNYKAWVRLLGGKEEAEKLRAEIQIEANGLRHEGKGLKVYPVDLSNADVMEDEECFELSRNQIRQCMEDPVLNGEDDLGGKLPGFAGIIQLQYRVKKIFMTYAQLVSFIGV